jgi:acetyl-CoA C-acetyltransferase
MMARGSCTENLGKDRLENEDVDLYELNEAFSVQALGVMRELNPQSRKSERNGGAVASAIPSGPAEPAFW